MIRSKIETRGEGFYEITDEIKSLSEDLIKNKNGLVFIFTGHTSCALTSNEAFDTSAKIDLENFLKHLAPRNLGFITHTTEGPDDSPSHMKSMLLHQNLTFPVVDGKIALGTWQGIYLAEFRDAPKSREIQIKFVEC